MTIREDIHNLFGVKEPHELPAKMMTALMDPTVLPVIIYDYKNMYEDLQHDYLRDYFQENQADRSNLMQDYTPESICQILAELTGEQETIADLCAGTGSLTIGAWKKSPNAKFICYEISSASIPFLLFNLSVREIEAVVIQGDVLTEDIEHIYKLSGGTIEEIQEYIPEKVDAVISNPPYSLKWSGTHDIRFGPYSEPPKRYADYAFVLIGLNMLKETGRATFVLPHGVLFRGGKEEEIRKQLLKDGRLDSVIGLPKELFAATSVPVALLTFTPEKSEDLLVINAENEVHKRPKQSVMEQNHIDTVLSAYRLRRDIDKLAHVANKEELEENDYDLNIPRYVSNWEPEELPPCEDIMKDLIRLEKEIKESKMALFEMFEETVVTDPDAHKKHDEWKELFGEWARM